jgi:hypothetical protein
MTPPLAPGTDVRALEELLSRTDAMNALAGLLLDWRVECERHLRSLTNIQRWVERIRSGTAGDGECDLLIQEIGRVLAEAPPRHTEWTHQAHTHLRNITR